MTTLATVLVLVAAILALFALIGLLVARQPLSTRALDARSRDLDDHGTALHDAYLVFADTLKVQTERRDAEYRMILDALTDDRQRLLTALLAVHAPQAAQLLGRVDEVQAKRERQMTMRDFLDETREERVRANETTDNDGNPIIPVGLGSS